MTLDVTGALTSQNARRVVDALGDAFAARDTGRVLAQFVDSPDIGYAGSEPGEVAVGRDAVAALLADLFARPERYGWRADAVDAIPTAGGVVVVAAATLVVDPLDGGPMELVPYRVTGLLEPAEDGWRWRFCQGSEPT